MQSQHNNDDDALSSGKDNSLSVLEPTDVFGFVTFENRGKAIETGTGIRSGSGSVSGSGSQFVARFAFNNEEDDEADEDGEGARKEGEKQEEEEEEEEEVGKGDKSLFWCGLDQLMHEILHLEKPDFVVSIHDEGKIK